MYKIAISGLGEAAQKIHIPAYSKLSNVEIVGGYDPYVTKADFPFPVYDSLEALLDKTRPDILTVATPTDFHFEQTKLGLKFGCHVFCEKPFTTKIEEAKEIILLAKSANRWVVINQEFRYMNIHIAAKDKIKKSDFGELLFLTAHQTFYVSDKTEEGWRGKDIQRTCKEFGIHVLDLCRYFFDEEPTSIYARFPKGSKPDGPDYLNLIQLEFSGDRVAHIILDRYSKGRHRYLDMRLDGSEGTVETSLGGNIELKGGIKGGTRKPYINLDISLGGNAYLYKGETAKKIASDPLDLFPNATSHLLKLFLEALDLGEVPPCHAEDNLKTLALMHAAYESHEKKIVVPVTHQE
jgi:predicted dehydrogenase